MASFNVSILFKTPPNLSGHLSMDLKTVIDTAPTLKNPRRTFTAEFKHQLIQQCQQPDTSVAKVAMQHQINANLYHFYPIKSLY